MAGPTRYRDFERPALINPDIGNTGDVQTAQTLANTFSDFEGTLVKAGNELSSNQGRDAGAAAGVAGTPKPRQGLSELTAYGRAYNSAAEVAYTNRQAIDMDSQLDTIEQDTEANPADYKVRAEGMAKGMLEASPPEYRPQLQLNLQRRISAGHQRISQQAIYLGRQEAAGAYLDGQGSRINSAVKTASSTPGAAGDQVLHDAIQDDYAQVQALVKTHAMTGVEAARHHANFTKMLDKQLDDTRIEGHVNELVGQMRIDVLKSDQSLAAINASKDISEDDKLLINEKYQKQREILSFERSRTHVNETVALSARLANKESGPALIHQATMLYHAAAISDNELRGFVDQNIRNQNEKDKDQPAIERYLARQKAGIGQDPKDEGTNGVGDKVFQLQTKQAGMVEGDPRWQQAATQMLHTDNILPSSAESWARISLLSRDPMRSIQAAGFIQKVKDSNPAAVKYFDDPKIAAFASQAAENVDAGIDPIQAHDVAYKNVYEVTEAQREQLKLDYRTTQAAKKNPGALTGAIGNDDSFKWNGKHFWDSRPGPNIAMRGEYETLVSQYFPLVGGDLEKAQKLASSKITKLWGVSTINGKPETMKYPPEKMYGLDRDTIRADMETTLKNAGVKVPFDEVQLAPNVQTDFTQGRKWTLVHTDASGYPDVLRDAHGKDMYYTLPMGHDIGKARVALHEKQRLKLEEAARLYSVQQVQEGEQQPFLGAPGMRN